MSEIKDPAYYAEMTCSVWDVGYSQKERTTIEFLEEDETCSVEADCSSAVNWWLYRGKYLDECIWFYTSMERQYLKDNGFIELNCDLFPAKRNDVLWRAGHTALHIGNGYVAELIHDENWDAGWEGSQSGDQTGDESRIISYNPYEWDYILRLERSEDDEKEEIEERISNMKCLITFDDDQDGYKKGDVVLWSCDSGFEYINDPDCVHILDEISKHYTGEELYRVTSSTKAPWSIRLLQATIGDTAKATYGVRS